MAVYLAHIRPEDLSEQTVLDHLTGTAERGAAFAAAFGAADWGRAAGLLHDIGKYSVPFQRRIRGAQLHTDHSTAGAQEARALGLFPAAFAIAGHHGGLPDGGAPGDADDAVTLMGRLKRKVEDHSPWRSEVEPPSAAPPEQLGKSPFGDAFFTRMLYSCLVDADYLDTEAFMTSAAPDRGGGEPMAALLDKLEKYITPWWGSDRSIDRERCSVLRACLDQGRALPPGLYTLTVPTGGGKTVSSLAFALRHAVRHGLERVIYVIPYTSIIEQTAQIFRDILGGENVLEHHCGVDYQLSDGCEDPVKRRNALATENWDAPVVVTTSVQFFESLYASRSSRCRKLHNISKSVIIFDEAQMLPLPYLRPCLAAVTQLVEHYGATAVLCTATQPALSGILLELAPKLQVRELCPDTRRLYDFFRRVTLAHDAVLSDQDLAARLNACPQVLCIVNSRRQAQIIFSLLEPQGSYHLSTLMYPAHRRAVLAEIRARLTAGLPCRVVSTSLIEAGVDVDFPTVYRSEAGLDSILQAAGRCNRENRRPREESVVHIFRPDTPPPPLFGPAAGAAREVMAQWEDWASPDAIRAYFQTLYTLKGVQAQDQKGILDAFARGLHGVQLPFASVAKEFRLIDTQTKTVYIPLEDGAALVEGLIAGERTRSLLRQLGQYAVALYPQHYQLLQSTGAIAALDEEISVLDRPDLYSPLTGLSISGDEGQALFI